MCSMFLLAKEIIFVLVVNELLTATFNNMKNVFLVPHSLLLFINKLFYFFIKFIAKSQNIRNSENICHVKRQSDKYLRNDVSKSIVHVIIVTRNEKIVWKHGPSMLCWNLPSGPKQRGSLQKKIAFFEGNQLFAFTSRILLQKACSYECHFCTKVCASSRLFSQVYMMAVQNIKKKYLMCQTPNKMLEQHAVPNSSLHNLKIYSSKECREILNLRIFSGRCYFRLWVFAFTTTLVSITQGVTK